MFCTLWYHQEYLPPAGEYYPESKIRLQIFSYLNLLYKFAQRSELRVWKHQFTGKYVQTGEGNGNQYYCLENSMDRGVWWATCSPWSCRVRHNLATKKTFPNLMAQRVKSLPAMQKPWVRSLSQEDPLEKKMALQSSILACKIPWTEEPGGLQGYSP